MLVSTYNLHELNHPTFRSLPYSASGLNISKTMFKTVPAKTSNLHKVSGNNVFYHRFKDGLLTGGKFDPLG